MNTNVSIVNLENFIMKSTPWKVQDDRIIIQRLEAPNKAGLIFIPDTAKELPLTGVVIGIGEGINYDLKTMEPLKGDRVVLGDIVLYGKYAGTEIPELIPNEKDPLVVLRWNDIICIHDTNVYGELREYLKK